MKTLKLTAVMAASLLTLSACASTPEPSDSETASPSTTPSTVESTFHFSETLDEQIAEVFENVYTASYAKAESTEIIISHMGGRATVDAADAVLFFRDKTALWASVTPELECNFEYIIAEPIYEGIPAPIYGYDKELPFYAGMDYEGLTDVKGYAMADDMLAIFFYDGMNPDAAESSVSLSVGKYDENNLLREVWTVVVAEDGSTLNMEEYARTLFNNHKSGTSLEEIIGETGWVEYVGYELSDVDSMRLDSQDVTFWRDVLDQSYANMSQPLFVNPLTGNVYTQSDEESEALKFVEDETLSCAIVGM